MKFKPEDFEIFKLTFAGIPVIGASEACSIANAKLEEMLKDALVVYSQIEGNNNPEKGPIHGAVTDIWRTDYHDISKALFKAKLIQIEEIK